ncbi:MAG: hypothetical protein ABI877_09205, partial [Gemmatimonadaceae bacterium]
QLPTNRFDAPARKVHELVPLFENPTVIRAAASLGDVPLVPIALETPPGIWYDLGGTEYRRSELSWQEAERPMARVAMAADYASLRIDILVRTPHVHFAPPCDENPLDNEHPDTNSDGAQLYIGTPSWNASWILVPEPAASRVRITPRDLPKELTIHVRASATHNSTGWQMRISIPRDTLPRRGSALFSLDLIVNLTAPGRERRQGQLVLSGGRGEWTYLRGDRQDADRALPFVIVDE